MFSSKRSSIIFVFIAFLLMLSCAAFFVIRGIEYYDEGYILYSAQRINQGEIPYRDFHFAYTPGSIFLTSFAFKIFGESILSERLMAFFISFLTLALLFFITRKISGNKLLLLIPALVYLFWGVAHINFVWPVMLAIFSGVLNCFLLLEGQAKRKNVYFLLAGSSVVVTALFKQNFGIALLVSNFLGYLFLKEFKDTKRVFYYLLGFAGALSLFLFYLLLSRSFIQFIDDFITYTIDRIIIEGTLNTQFIYGDSLVNKIIKTLLFLSPFLMASFSFFLSLKNKKPYIIIGGFSGLYYLFGIRPTVDYNHLVPLLAISGIPLVISIRLIKKKFIKFVLYILAFFLIILGLHTALFKGYYRWEAPIIENNFFANNPKLLIWLDKGRYEGVQKLSLYIKKRTRENEYIYVNYYAPLIYFLSERRNATKFALHPSNKSMQSYQREVVSNLQSKQVKLLVTHISNQSENTIVGKFINKYYRPIQIIDDFVVWYRVE